MTRTNAEVPLLKRICYLTRSDIIGQPRNFELLPFRKPNPEYDRHPVYLQFYDLPHDAKLRYPGSFR